MSRHVVALGAVVALAACTDDGRHVRSFVPRGCTTTATGDTAVSVALRGGGVTLDPARTTAGRVAFVVRNVDSAEHTFQVARVGTRPTVVGGVAKITAGGVCATALTLPPGSYQVYCDLDDHFSDGEHRTLRVT